MDASQMLDTTSMDLQNVKYIMDNDMLDIVGFKPASVAIHASS